MSRRLSALVLLVAILSASAGMLLFATLRLQLHHYRMSHAGEAGLVELEVSPSAHPELLRGVRELRLNGRWFDVEKVAAEAGTLIVTGHYDEEEEHLLSRIERFSRDIRMHGREWAPVLSPPVYFESPIATVWIQPIATELMFPDPVAGLPEIGVAPPVPPPLGRA